MEKSIVYATVREEILEQKKCQFQMFVAAITFSSALFAFAFDKNVTPVIFIVPVIMNVFAFTIILDKSISIQRMVGYLQVMESEKSETEWMWEYHLDKFRGSRIDGAGRDTARKHRYILHIALMLFALNIISVFLLISKLAVQIRLNNVEILILIIVGLVFAWGIWNFLTQVNRFIRGGYTSEAVRKRWIRVIGEGTGPPSGTVTSRENQ